MKKARAYNLKPVFTDNRGHIFDILEDRVEHVGMVTFNKKGVERGGHYHKKSTQYTYVINGRIKLVISDLDGKSQKEFLLTRGTVAMIPPNTIHTYISLSKAELLDMTTLSRRDRGYESDTIRVGKI